jgi:hypothetical protein
MFALFVYEILNSFRIEKYLKSLKRGRNYVRHISHFEYCNVNDKALLGNDSVKQQWKRSDRCYAMTQCTHINNGGEDVFYVVGAVVISQVVATEKSASLTHCVYSKTETVISSFKFHLVYNQ